MSRRVAVAGVGYSDVQRRSPYTSNDLLRQAVGAALDDAGMKNTDVDGVVISGFSALSTGQLLGIMPMNLFSTSTGLGPAFSEVAVSAMAAVASGTCHTAVAIRIMRQEGGGRPSSYDVVDLPDGPRLVGGMEQWRSPFGASLPATFLGALQMQRYMSEFGATEEDFAINAVIQREYATRNPDAIFRDPLTVEEYLASRYISKPIRLLDCDYPVDVASAVIFTSLERARDFAKPPVVAESWAVSAVRDVDMTLLEDFTGNSTKTCSDALWSRTDLKPADVDTAHLYDGFTIMTFEWLEALGFCGRGEAAAFIREGNTRQDGSLPVNTDGGAVNMGRRHGPNFCIEAVRQIRGECGDRQVDGTEVSVWTNASGSFGGGAIFTADR